MASSQQKSSRPSRLDNVPFAVVFLVELAAVASVSFAPQHWLRAVGVMTVGLAIGGFFRLVLSDERAGLLRVRHRTFDVACYWSFGLVAILLALALPGR